MDNIPEDGTHGDTDGKNVTQTPRLTDSQDSQDSQRNLTLSRDATFSIEGKRFDEIALWAYLDARKAANEAYIQDALLWNYIRNMTVLRARGQTAKQVFNDTCRLIKGWRMRQCKNDHETYTPGDDGWRHWFQTTMDEAEVKFLADWERIRFTPGMGPIESALLRAKKTTLTPKPEIMEHRPSLYKRFITVVGWLQVTVGDNNIMLPCRKMGKHLEISHMTVQRLRQMAVEDGYLKIVRAHVYKGKIREATEFRFDISRFKCLVEASAKTMPESFTHAQGMENA